MKAEINLITIWSDEIDRMKRFYNEVLGFRIKNDLGNYVEFENNGVRFAICLREVMTGYIRLRSRLLRFILGWSYYTHIIGGGNHN